MTHLQALLLGIVQGLTEFLPVSSSTHLTLVKRLLGCEGSIYFDLLCHLGTLVAAMIVLRKEIWSVLKSPKMIALFTLALLPLLPAYLLFKPLRILLADYSGIFLLCTSALLFAASRPAVRISAPYMRNLKESPKWQDVLCIGIAQSLALVPGISRSGSTIAVARMLGWEWKEAARFSFLLAMPAILGGCILETMHGGPVEGEFGVCILGFTASLVVGLGSIRLLFWLLDKGTLKPFAFYCLGIGILALCA